MGTISYLVLYVTIRLLLPTTEVMDARVSLSCLLTGTPFHPAHPTVLALLFTQLIPLLSGVAVLSYILLLLPS